MKKAFIAILFVTALIVGYASHTSETAYINVPEPTASVKLA